MLIHWEVVQFQLALCIDGQPAGYSFIIIMVLLLLLLILQIKLKDFIIIFAKLCYSLNSALRSLTNRWLAKVSLANTSIRRLNSIQSSLAVALIRVRSTIRSTMSA